MSHKVGAGVGRTSQADNQSSKHHFYVIFHPK